MVHEGDSSLIDLNCSIHVILEASLCNITSLPKIRKKITFLGLLSLNAELPELINDKALDRALEKLCSFPRHLNVRGGFLPLMILTAIGVTGNSSHRSFLQILMDVVRVRLISCGVPSCWEQLTYQYNLK